MKRNELKKIMLVIAIFLVLIFVSQEAYAAREFKISDIFTFGNKIVQSGEYEKYDYDGLEKMVKSLGTEIIKPIGYLIFAIITVVLGVQYIWSGYDGKSKVKETMPPFICAVVLFYVGEQVVTLLISILDTKYTSMQQFTGNIWVNVCNVVQILAFAGILFVGVKYLMENSEGKAKIKERLVPMLVGTVFVFCAANVVSYIIRIAEATI